MSLGIWGFTPKYQTQTQIAKNTPNTQISKPKYLFHLYYIYVLYIHTGCPTANFETLIVCHSLIIGPIFITFYVRMYHTKD